MIEQGLFKRHFVGRDGFYWWIGQIAPIDTWGDNIPGTNVQTNTDERYVGVAERYKVRIMGYNTAIPTEITDDQLPWATVMYPVTAGGGSGGLSETASLTQGTFVFGFFLDGEDAQQPVIMGCLGYNDYQEVMQNVPDAKFVPFSGYETGELVSRGAQRSSGGGETLPQTRPGTGSPNNSTTTESSQQGTTLQSKLTEDESVGDSQKQPIAQPTSCEPIPVGGIQQALRNAIQDIERVKRSVNDVRGAASSELADKEAFINKKLKEASDFIAKGMKWVYEQIEKFVYDKTNRALRDVYNIAFPNERNTVKQTSNNILDTISCFFKKIISNLSGMILEFLKEAIDKVINVSECFVQNFVGKIFGALTGVINGLFNGLQSLIDGITDIAETGLDLAGDSLQLVDSIISFLSCDERPDCAQVNSWSILQGPGSLNAGDFQSLVDSGKRFVEDIENVGLDALNNFEGLNDINFDGLFDNPDCNIREILCGPPTLDIIGQGEGATGNLVIGALGEVLSVDMTSFGYGYSPDTIAQVIDACGKGKGAVLRPIYGEVSFPRSQSGQVASNETVSTGTDLGFGPFDPTPYRYDTEQGTLVPQNYPSTNPGPTPIGGSGIPQIFSDDLLECIDVQFTVRREAALVNRFTFTATQRPTQGLGVINFSFTGNDIGTFTECIIPEIDYIVEGTLPDGRAVPNPLRLFDNGSTVALDDEFEGPPREVITTVVNDGFVDVTFDIAREADFDTIITFQRVEGEGPNELVFDNRNLGSSVYSIKRGSLYTLSTVVTEGIVDVNADLRVVGNTLQLDDLRFREGEIQDSDFNDIEITPNFGQFTNSTTYSLPIIEEEVVTIEQSVISDLDYDDLVITASRGKFTKVQGNRCIFRLSVLPEPPNITPSTSTPEPVEGFTDVELPSTPPTRGDTVGIIDILVVDPGTGYLSGPDGSKGGDGRTWADPDDAIIVRSDGRIESPVPCGTNICVNIGDVVEIPAGTSVVTTPNSGQGGDELIIGGSPHTMSKPGCFTAPCADYESPPSGYPIILYLCDIFIESAGIGYMPTDSIIIEPSMGAEAELTVDIKGRITSVKVTKPGEGFTVFPKVYVQTNTGVGAVLTPKLCIDRIEEVREPDQEKVITVVDCVGKFNV